MAITTAPHRSGHPAHHGQPIMIAVLIAALAVVTIGIVLLLVYGGSSNSGVQGSRAAATQTRSMAAFSSLDLTGSNNVTVIVGRPQSVVVHADSNLINHVTTGVVAGTLVIGDTGSFSARTPMSVNVSVPSLTTLSLSGDGQDQLSQLTARDVQAVVTGSGLIQVTATTSLDAAVPGDGEIVYGGNPPQVTTSVTGSGSITRG